MMKIFRRNSRGLLESVIERLAVIAYELHTGNMGIFMIAKPIKLHQKGTLFPEFELEIKEFKLAFKFSGIAEPRRDKKNWGVKMMEYELVCDGRTAVGHLKVHSDGQKFLIEAIDPLTGEVATIFIGTSYADRERVPASDVRLEDFQSQFVTTYPIDPESNIL